MAYEQVENGIAVRYHGISVYNTYKNDFMENSKREYQFTLAPFGLEGDEDTFDIREMQGYDSAKSVAANLVQMINAHLFGDSPAVDVPVTDENDPYSAANTQDNFCPVCGTALSDYDLHEVHDDQIEYPFTCSNCLISGSQWGRISFAGYTLD